jgi:chaperonin cofactor prefoldin
MITGGRLLGTVAAIATASCFALGQPTQAQDIMNLVENLTGITNRGGNVDARQTEIQEQIRVGLRTGQLTLSEANDFRVELNRIDSLKTSFMSDGRLSFSESSALMRDLNALSARVEADLASSGPIVPTTSAEVDARQSLLDRKIVDAQASGQLTRIEVQALRNELNRVADMEATFKADGALTANEVRTLLTELDEVNSHIRLQVRDDDIAHDNVEHPNINLKQAEIERGIAAGLRSGRLTHEEAAEIRAEFNRLADLEAEYRASGGFMSRGEATVLNRGLSSLMARLKLEVHDQDVASRDIDEKQTRLANRITQLESTATLTAAQAAELRSELEFIADAETYFRHSGGILTQTERERLLGDLDRLASRIDRLAMRHPLPVVSTAQYDAKKAQVQSRITRGETSGRLTAQEARMLRRQLNQIANLEMTLKADGRLDRRELARLNSDLDNLENVVWQEMTDRQYAGDRYRRFF